MLAVDAIPGSRRPARSEDPERERIQLGQQHTELVGRFTEAEPGIPLVFSPLFVRACSGPEGIKAGEESLLPYVDPTGAPSSLELALACGTSTVTWVRRWGQTRI